MGAAHTCSFCCFSSKLDAKAKESDSLLSFSPAKMPDLQSESTADGEPQAPESILHMCEREVFLSAIAEATDKFLKIVHEPVDASYELTVEKDGCRVHTKESPTGCIARAEWTVPFPPQVYLSFLTSNETRKSWDSHIDTVRTVEQIDPSVTLSYLCYRRVLTMSPRDLVIASKAFDSGEGLVNVYCSVDALACPQVPGIVRASIVVGGYFLEDLSQGSNVPLTRVVSYSDASCGVPKALMRRVTATQIPKLVKQIEDSLRANSNTS